MEELCQFCELNDILLISPCSHKICFSCFRCFSNNDKCLLCNSSILPEITDQLIKFENSKLKEDFPILTDQYLIFCKRSRRKMRSLLSITNLYIKTFYGREYEPLSASSYSIFKEEQKSFISFMANFYDIEKFFDVNTKDQNRLFFSHVIHFLPQNQQMRNIIDRNFIKVEF